MTGNPCVDVGVHLHMRRLLIVCAALALAFPGAAAAGGLYVKTTTPPNGLRVGQVWTAELTVATCLGQASEHVVPALRLEQQATGRTLVVVGRRTRAGWIAKVRFPSAGTWSVSPGTRDGTLFAEHRVTVGATQSRTAGFSRWPIAGGLLMLAGAGALALRRHRRLG
jgi:hypothetical protein